MYKAVLICTNKKNAVLIHHEMYVNVIYNIEVINV